MNGENLFFFLAADVSRAVLCAVWERKEENRKQPHKVDCVSGADEEEPVSFFLFERQVLFSISALETILGRRK